MDENKDLELNEANEFDDFDNIIVLNDEDGNEVKMTESVEESDEDLSPLIEGDDYRYDKEESFEAAGYTEASDISELDSNDSDNYESAELNLDVLKF